MTAEENQATTDPTVPGGWEREFVLALRNEGFDGIQISDALTAVEARCAACGLSPYESFGDAVAYASYLRLPRPRRSRRSTAAVAVPVLGLAMGVNLTFDAVMQWQDRVVISLGSVAAMGALIVLIAVLARVLPRAIATTVNLASCLAGGVALTLLLQWALPRELTTVQPVLVLAIGLLLICLGLVVRQLQPRRMVAAGRP